MTDRRENTLVEGPPRRRRRVPLWVKVTAGLVFVFVVLPGAYLWWGGYCAERELQTRIAAIRTAGEPIDLEDFDPVFVPDDQNAYLAFVGAAQAVEVAEVEGNELGVLDDSSLARRRPDLVKQIVDANAAALGLARQARALPGVDTGIRMRSPAVSMLCPDLSPLKRLGELLCATAAYRHHTGDDREAVESLRDVLRLARVVDETPTFIGHLLSVSIESLAMDTLESIAPGLRAGRKDVGTDASEDARRQVMLLTAELLDKTELEGGLLRAFLGERALMLDAARCTVDGTLSMSEIYGDSPTGPVEFAQNMLARLRWKRELPELVDAMTMNVDAARRDTWPEAKKKAYVAGEGKFFSRSWKFRQPSLVEVLIPSLNRGVMLHFKAVALRRMGAAALAVRLYEADYGRRPGTLGELVPEYLPAVPEDPFADDGSAIGYLPNADPPVLYSIGSDGVDDGGEVHLNRRGAIDWEEELPFFLNGDRDEVISRHAEAASQPGE